MANTNSLPQLPACNLPTFAVPGIPDLISILIGLIPGWPPTLPTTPLPFPYPFPCPFSEVP